ncbi:MAG TPA: hypothetical protein EYH34_15645 [Planctomycetes bacterium]|nr:hypothetical protein [Planctomycetota bacterium]
MTKRRRHFTAAQKAEIGRRHVAGKEPVSRLAEEYQLQPSQIHQWVRQVLDNTESVFLRGAARSAPTTGRTATDRAARAKSHREERADRRAAARTHPSKQKSLESGYPPPELPALCPIHSFATATSRGNPERPSRSVL